MLKRHTALHRANFTASAGATPMGMQKAANRPYRVVIVGGGIGGLTAAVALHQRGFEVAVYERSPQARRGRGRAPGRAQRREGHPRARALGRLRQDRVPAGQPGLDQVGRREPAPPHAAEGDRRSGNTARPTRRCTAPTCMSCCAMRCRSARSISMPTASARPRPSIARWRASPTAARSRPTR